MKTKQLSVLIVLFTLFIGSPSYALSNDPLGKIFISKTFGDFSNCGPISALMLAKYINADFSNDDLLTNIKKARKITAANKNIDNRWWRMRDIKKYLQHMSVKYDEVIMTDSTSIEDRKEHIINALHQGSAVLINVNMNHLPQGSEVGKPYLTFPLLGAWGHFLVIVGYEEVDGKTVFEIHDSYTKKGKNRLFYANHIMNSINRYNREVLFVKNTRTMDNLWASAEW